MSEFVEFLHIEHIAWVKKIDKVAIQRWHIIGNYLCGEFSH